MQTYPIVFSTDKNYAKYLGVAIQSVIENSSSNNNYKIFILYESLTNDILGKLKLHETSNIQIEFINVTNHLEKYNDKLTPIHHYSKAMYYRLLIPEIFKDFSKILYLDCDLIVNCDVEDFFEIDLQNKAIGVVNDIGMLNTKQKWYEYSKNLSIEPEKYFNSGVLIIDIKKMGEINIIENSYKILAKPFNFHFPDQDILNILFKNNVLLLDYKYNFQWCEYLNGNNNADFSNIDLYNQYLHTIQNFKILHFTSAIKPWTNPEILESYYFWKYARNSIFYEEILAIYALKKVYSFRYITNFNIMKYRIKSLIPNKKQRHYKKKYMAFREREKFLKNL